MLLRTPQRMRHIRWFGTTQTDEKQAVTRKFSLNRLDILPFVGNATAGGLCAAAAFYNTKSIPYVSGLIFALGTSSKVVPSMVALSGTLGVAQIGFTLVLLYGAKIFAMNVRDICYKPQ